jgi:hypothetical protein
MTPILTFLLQTVVVVCVARAVGYASMLLPFGLGLALAFGVSGQFGISGAARRACRSCCSSASA